MQTQNQGTPSRDGQQHMHEWARKQRALEINPRSPLIEGLLRKYTALKDVEGGEEPDAELEREVQEISGILIDGALVRSGFDVPDSNECVHVASFWSRFDSMSVFLSGSLSVSTRSSVVRLASLRMLQRIQQSSPHLNRRTASRLRMRPRRSSHLNSTKTSLSTTFLTARTFRQD